MAVQGLRGKESRDCSELTPGEGIHTHLRYTICVENVTHLLLQICEGNSWTVSWTTLHK